MRIREDAAVVLARRIAEAQEIQITNGPIVAVMEGRLRVWDALRDAARERRFFNGGAENPVEKGY